MRFLRRTSLVTVVVVIAALGACSRRSPAGDGPQPALLGLDQYGALVTDARRQFVTGYTRAGDRLTEAWRVEIDASRLLDVVCASRCPRAAMQVFDPTGGPSTVRFLDEHGRSTDAYHRDLTAAGSLMHVLRWSENLAVITRRNPAGRMELVVRDTPGELAVPVVSPDLRMELSGNRATVVANDGGRVVVLSRSNTGRWSVVWRDDAARAVDVCVDPAGARVQVLAERDQFVDVLNRTSHGRPSPEKHANACALTGSWLLRGVQMSKNGVPNSRWQAETFDGAHRWNRTYDSVGEPVTAATADMVCLLLTTPTCLDGTGSQRQLDGPVTLDHTGELVWLRNDGTLTPVDNG